MHIVFRRLRIKLFKFGQFSLSLPLGTYTMVVLGHGLSNGEPAITLTSLAIASLAGIILNAILPGNDYEFGKGTPGDISVNFGPRTEEEVKNR